MYVFMYACMHACVCTSYRLNLVVGARSFSCQMNISYDAETLNPKPSAVYARGFGSPVQDVPGLFWLALGGCTAACSAVLTAIS